MAGEEILLKKISNAEREHALENLGLELDDLDLEVDDQARVRLSCDSRL